MKDHLRAIGLMSGTSGDGVDAALIETDGMRVVRCGPTLSRPYDLEFRARLMAIMGGQGAVAAVAEDLTNRHADAVQALLAAAGLGRHEIDVIGFHGQTILHQPELGRTWQIGDGARLADLTGIAVVNDFRSADVAAGGQGAPLAPLYHSALAADLPRPVAILNIGGVANVTWIGDGDDILAFDTGPGNALIDDWALRHTGRPLDRDGALAQAGTVDEAVLAGLMRNPYFDRPAPKSLDRNEFDPGAVRSLSAAAGAATLVAFTIAAVARARELFPHPVRQWLVCGGGRHNPALMAGLAGALAVPVAGVDSIGWDGDALEAQAFAYLAVRSLKGLPLSLPTTTGVRQPTTGGRLHRPR